MLANSMTIDTTLTGTLSLSAAAEAEEVVFTRKRYVADKSEYHADDHSEESQHKVEFYRTPAKASGNYRGSQKAKVKYTKDVTVPNRDGSGNIVAPIVVTLGFSYPLGTTDPVLKEVIRKMTCLTFLADVVTSAPNELVTANVLDLEV